jgi:hypothetical protein
MIREGFDVDEEYMHEQSEAAVHVFKCNAG